MKIVKTGNDFAWKNNKMIISGWFSFFCNYHCSYCINETYKKNYPMALSPKALSNLMEFLPQLNKTSYNFSIAGGEALLYPHLNLFFDYLSNYNKKGSCFLMTNGVLLDRAAPFADNDNYNLTVCISFHNEQTDLSVFLDRLKKFKKPEICTINLLMKPGEKKEIESICSKLNGLGYKRVWIRGILTDNKLDSKYTPDEISYLFKKTAELSQVYTNYVLTDSNEIEEVNFHVEDFRNNHELVNYQGMHCTAGYNAIRVLPDGSVSPCVNLPATEGFNLNSSSILEYPLLKKEFICPKDSCLCPPYITLAKWDSKYFSAPEYYLK